MRHRERGNNTRIRDEALRRGHTIKGISRDPVSIPAKPGLVSVSGNIDDPLTLARLLVARTRSSALGGSRFGPSLAAA
jgi:putative NADH-flavin reductase